MYCIHKMFKGTFVGGLVWNVHMVVEVLQEAVLAAVAHSTEAAGEHHSTHTTTHNTHLLLLPTARHLTQHHGHTL